MGNARHTNKLTILASHVSPSSHEIDTKVKFPCGNTQTPWDIQYFPRVDIWFDQQTLTFIYGDAQRTHGTKQERTAVYQQPSKVGTGRTQTRQQYVISQEDLFYRRGWCLFFCSYRWQKQKKQSTVIWPAAFESNHTKECSIYLSCMFVKLTASSCAPWIHDKIPTWWRHSLVSMTSWRPQDTSQSTTYLTINAPA